MSIGVVILLPEPLASRVRQIQLAYGSQAAEIAPHITLISLEEGLAQSLLTAPLDWEAAAAHVRQVCSHHRPFSVSLEGAQTFLPVSPVTYLGVGEGTKELESLTEDLRTGPLEHTPAFEYVPHVTLIHPGEDRSLLRCVQEHSEFRDRFEVASIGLYQQSPSGRWEHREEIPLGNSPQAQE